MIILHEIQCMKSSILDTISFLTVSWDLTLLPIKSMIELRNVV